MAANGPDRRDVLKGAAGLALSASLTARTRAVFAAGATTANDVLVIMFLHGGQDGLNFLAPADDANYLAARPDTLRVSSDATPGLQLAGGPTSNDWRLHPNAAPLQTLYNAGKLAFVHAAGLLADTRSHFQAIDLMERGITDPSQISSANGWLTKHMRNVGLPIAATSTSTIIPERLTGDTAADAMVTPTQFQLNRADFASYLTSVYTGSAPLASAASLTVNTAVSFSSLAKSLPPSNNSKLSSTMIALNTVVQLIQLNAGLQVATVEVGGWDTHVGQKKVFDGNVTDLANSLATFQNNVTAIGANVTLVAMTEFGRRLKSNASLGTDHGHGSVMMVMGNAVNGGKIYGQWPGLAASALNLGDLNITTDYRNVVSEILVKRRGEQSLSTVFPTFTGYAPMGIV